MDEPGQPPDPVAGLAWRLRELRIRAGNPSLKELGKLTGQQGRAMVGRSTIDEKLRGKTAPSLEQLLAVVGACAQYAQKMNHPLAPEEVDAGRWRAAWEEMESARVEERSRRRPPGELSADDRHPSASGPMVASSQLGEGIDESEGVQASTLPLPRTSGSAEEEFRRGVGHGIKFSKHLGWGNLNKVAREYNFDVPEWLIEQKHELAANHESLWRRIVYYLGNVASLDERFAPSDAYVRGFTEGIKVAWLAAGGHDVGPDETDQAAAALAATMEIPALPVPDDLSLEPAVPYRWEGQRGDSRTWVEKDLYGELGVPSSASANDIERAYCKLARVTHAAAIQGDKEAEERFRSVSEAYDVLHDPDKRKQYDEARSIFAPRPPLPPKYRNSAKGFGGGGFDLGDLFGVDRDRR